MMPRLPDFDGMLTLMILTTGAIILLDSLYRIFQ